VNYSSSGPRRCSRLDLKPGNPPQRLARGTHTLANPTEQRRSVCQRQITHLEKNYDWQLLGEVGNKFALAPRMESVGSLSTPGGPEG